MGVAAYNRGSRAISQRIALESRPAEFVLLEDLNRLPKYPDAGTPFGPVTFTFARGRWWVECPTTGYGFHYATLREAVRRWNVVLTGWRSGIFDAEPAAKR
jgi:hypothetical protein